mgnify:FL=1
MSPRVLFLRDWVTRGGAAVSPAFFSGGGAARAKGVLVRGYQSIGCSACNCRS